MRRAGFRDSRVALHVAFVCGHSRDCDNRVNVHTQTRRATQHVSRVPRRVPRRVPNRARARARARVGLFCSYV